MSSENKSFITELLLFLWKKKVWWIMPIILMLIIVGVFIVFAQSSPLSPLIYAMF